LRNGLGTPRVAIERDLGCRGSELKKRQETPEVFFWLRRGAVGRDRSVIEREVQQAVHSPPSLPGDRNSCPHCDRLHACSSDRRHRGDDPPAARRDPIYLLDAERAQPGQKSLGPKRYK
jgi:hypothetical protein